MFGITLVLLGSLDHVSNSLPTASDKSALRASVLWTAMWIDSATTPPHCRKQRCFGASPTWIQAFQLDINALLYMPKASAEPPSAYVHTVGVPTDLNLKKVIADHPSIFEPGLGLCTKTKAHLQLRHGVQTKLLKARPVPFSRINAVEKELQGLEELKIVTKVGYPNCSRTEAEWQK